MPRDDLNGKEIQKRGEGCVIYTHLLHCAARQKLTQHCKATALQENSLKPMSIE